MNKKILNYYFELIKLFIESKISAMEFENGYFAKWSQLVESETEHKSKNESNLYKFIYDIFPYIEDYIDKSIVGEGYHYKNFEIDENKLFLEVNNLYNNYINSRL